MIEKATSKSCAKWIEEAPVREVIVEETTTSHIYWDSGFKFDFSKYTAEDKRLSHALVRVIEEDGRVVGLIESWSPRKVFAPDKLRGCDQTNVIDFLECETKNAWMYQAVHCEPLDDSDAGLLDRPSGDRVICVWRYYHDQDDDLVLGQRFVVTGGYAAYYRRPLLSYDEEEIEEREQTSWSSA